MHNHKLAEALAVPTTPSKDHHTDVCILHHLLVRRGRAESPSGNEVQDFQDTDVLVVSKADAREGIFLSS